VSHCAFDFIKMQKQIKIKHEKNVEHWPSLNTVIMVENVMKKMNGSVISIAEIKRKLPRQVNHNTLMVILRYLEESNKILVSLDGITWIHNSNINLRRAIKIGFENK